MWRLSDQGEGRQVGQRRSKSVGVGRGLKGEEQLKGKELGLPPARSGDGVSGVLLTGRGGGRS